MNIIKQAITTPSLSRQGMIRRLFCVLMLAIAASISLPSFAETAYVSTYEELKTAIGNTLVDNIVVTANINVPCSTSVTSTANPDYSGASTAQLVISRSLTLQSQAGYKYTIKRIAADGATTNCLKSIISIRGSGNGTSGSANLTENNVAVTFKNIIIDGGADWGESEYCDRYAAATNAYGNSGRAMIDIFLGGTLNLEDGVVLQNGFTTYSINSVVNNSGSNNYGGAVRVEYHAKYGGGTVNVKAGAIIHDCTASGYGGALGAYNFARLNLYGGTIYNCSSGNGGAIGCTWRNGSDHATSGTVKMYGGTIHNCCASNGGAISMDGTVANYIIGGSIENCSASSNGSAICIPESGTTVNIVAYTSHLLTITDCTGESDTSTENTGGYEGVYLNENATIANYPVYHVTFRNNNTNFAVLSVAQGTSLGEAFPAAPVNANFRFVGWYNGETQVTSSTEISGNITVTAKWDFQGSGTEAAPYQIPSAEVWNFLADQVAAGNSYSGKYFRMTADIGSALSPVTTMVGNSGNHFSGIFDGQGHTLTINYSGNDYETRSAPFSFTSCAAIQNLIVTGNCVTDGRAAGIVGESPGSAATTVTNCVSSVTIGGGLIGGIALGGNVDIKGCLFNGTINGTQQSGGFVGWGVNTTKITNSLFAPQNGSSINGCTFYFTGEDTGGATISNCYYTKALGTAQGKFAHSISGGIGVTVANAGTATEYDVSGITSYDTGILYGGKLYAGDGDVVSLSLSHVSKTGFPFNQYAVTGGGTLANPTTNSPTLTMSAANQTIKAQWNFSQSGTSEDPYLISSTDHWNVLAENVYSGKNYAGEFFRQTADFTITKMVGATENANDNNNNDDVFYTFNGTYDGDGHTLDLDLNVTGERYAGPFHCVSSATIKNLIVTGSVTVSNTNNVVESSRHPSALIGCMREGNVLIENCLVSANVSGADYMGGLIGHSWSANVTMRGCVYSGILTAQGSNYTGGLIGWGGDGGGMTFEFTNNLFAGSYSGSGKFHPIGCLHTIDNNTRTITNTYYTTGLKNMSDNDDRSLVKNFSYKGERAYSVTGGTGVTVASAGTATATYNVSKLTFYGSNGFAFNGELYGASDDVVSINLSGSSNYKASAGTLSGSSNPYSLTMTSVNSVIYGAASVAAAPSANSLYYSGAAQALVTAGTPNGGTFKYSTDNSTWSNSIPAATNVGNYTVYYMVEGDATHADFTPSTNTIAVSIAKDPLKRVVTIADNKYVSIAPGNLQYVGENTWRFAEHQWDYFGNTQADNHRDIFCWGTGNSPNNTSSDYSQYSTFVDWGINIGSGWRTPTKDEWKYFLSTRANASSLRGLAQITISDVTYHGLLVLPDNWSGAEINTSLSSYANNSYDASAWAAMDAQGAIFIPAAGYRPSGYTGAWDVNSWGRYWTSTPISTDKAYYVSFEVSSVNPERDDRERSSSRSVRLIQEIATAPAAVDDLVYTGSAQTLISAGTANFGTMKYSLDNSSWGTSLPTATNAGDYTVYFMIEGDANHEDFTPTNNTVAVTITPKTVTIPTAVTGLMWSGEEQTGVEDGDDYTVTNGTATDIGNYTATAALNSTTNYQWSNATTEPKEIPWTIGAMLFEAGATSDWRTWYNNADMTVDTDVMETYVVTNVTSSESAKTVTVTSTDGKIYKNTPMLLKRKEGVTDAITVNASETALTVPEGFSTSPVYIGNVSSFANYLTGTVYVLAGSEFVRARVTESTPFDKSKCFIYLTSGNANNSRLIIIGDGATGINPVVTDGENDTWYTIGGRKLSKQPKQPGVYISNGKKVIVK